MQRFKVTIKVKSGIPYAMRNYCDKCGISVWKFITNAITDKLRKPVEFSDAEIGRKRPHDYGLDMSFYFGISDEITLEKIRMIREDYGVSLNYFFTRTIAEKLKELGAL